MSRRLAQLAEEANPLKDDPKAGIPMQDGSFQPKDQNVIDEIYNRIQRSGGSDEFKLKYQRAIESTKIPDAASRQDREIALAQPWEGQESEFDVSHRMLQDAYKPLKKSSIGSGSITIPKKKPVVSRSQRLSNARERSLDYKLMKGEDDKVSEDTAITNTNGEDEERETFKELYKERLLGPSGASNLFSTINSIASQRIEDAIARGQFKNLPRGKEIKHELSPFIDTTEYFLNRMIKRQGAAPPWIEKQTNVNTRLQLFRDTIAAQWRTRATHTIVTRFKSLSLEEKLEKTMKYAHYEQTNDRRRLRDSDWEKEQRQYHELSITEINNAIRGYNLQAPGSARKGYINLDSELETCYQTVASQLPDSVRRYIEPSQPLDIKLFQAQNGLHTKSNDTIYQENPKNHYGFRELFRDLLSRRKKPKPD